MEPINRDNLIKWFTQIAFVTLALVLGAAGIKVDVPSPLTEAINGILLVLSAGIGTIVGNFIAGLFEKKTLGS